MTTLLAAGTTLSINAAETEENKKMDKPNLIMIMCDDLGWGDVGFNGNKIIKTPNLDQMAQNSVQFNRFYAAAPVCSPTRGSCITGRHPYRYGIYFANVGSMKKEEMTLAEILKPMGYSTGHFGKWHLGTLTTKIKDANRGGRKAFEKEYSTPAMNGFDEYFSTESKVPTCDPMKKPLRAGKCSWDQLSKEAKYKAYNTRYWTGPDKFETENLEGDDSRIIMDRAIPFIEKSVKKQEPFFSVIWFHTPHLPVVAEKKYAEMYKDYDRFKRNYYGCITAMDAQVGRLRAKLKELGVADNTVIFFCSDNGPEGKAGRQPGSAGPFRGRKRDLYEGGIRVPALMEWPAKIKNHKVIDTATCTSDYLPTVLAALGYELKGKAYPIDGENLMPFINGENKERQRAIGFQSRNNQALNGNRYKLISTDKGRTFELYDMVNDPSEKTDIAKKHPEVVKAYKKQLKEWIKSCRRSDAGKDYAHYPEISKL